MPEERLLDAASPVAEDAWAWLREGLLIEVCDLPWSCPQALRRHPTTAGRFPSPEACRAALTQTLTAPALAYSPSARPAASAETLAGSLRSGKTLWDAEAAAACRALDVYGLCALAERSEVWATGQWPADSPCARALIGQGQADSLCVGGWECAPGLLCLPDPSSPSPSDCARRCAPRSRSTCAAPNGQSTACGPFMRCDQGQCVDEGRAGDPCGRDAPCAQDLGLICATDGVCVGVSDAPRLPAGAACDLTQPWRCDVGLRCDAGGACAPIQAQPIGAPCDLSSGQTCAGGGACWLSQYENIPDICASASPIGGPCQYDVQCPWDASCALTIGLCVARAVFDSACP